MLLHAQGLKEVESSLIVPLMVYARVLRSVSDVAAMRKN